MELSKQGQRQRQISTLRHRNLKPVITGESFRFCEASPQFPHLHKTSRLCRNPSTVGFPSSLPELPSMRPGLWQAGLSDTHNCPLLAQVNREREKVSRLEKKVEWNWEGQKANCWNAINANITLLLMQILERKKDVKSKQACLVSALRRIQ